jgi:N-acyl-L-homoserine lactone synthetase
LDALASSFVRDGAPVAFRRAASPDEVHQVHRLRYRTVIERGWATPADHPEGIETDEFDEGALQFVAVDGPTVIGSCRLVLPQLGRPLPVEAFFDISLQPQGEVAHVDRALVVPASRSRDGRVFAGLIGRTWLELRERGFSAGSGMVSRGILRLYRRLGVELEVLGPPRRVWGEDRVPVRFGPKPPR